MIALELSWSQVGTNLVEINNQNYLVIDDYVSGFIEINLLQNGTTSKQIVTCCKSQFLDMEFQTD